MTKKRILYIHHGKGLGGAPLSLLYLIQALDKTKYEPVVLFLHDSDALKLYRSKNITVYGPVNLMDFSHTKIFWYRWYHVHRFLKVVYDSFKTYYYIANYWLDLIKPDLVHLNTSSLIFWAKVAYNKNIPVVCHVREPLSDGYFGLRKRIVRRFVAKYSNMILPICKNDSKPWQNSSKVNIIYNAVDKSIFNLNIKNIYTENSKILFLGGLSKEKGTLEILEIFQKLLKVMPEAKLLIAGYFDLSLNSKFNLKHYFPTELYKLKVKNSLEKIKKSVIFLGPINNVAQALVESNVLVFPATVGHFARPVIEAGFMAKPVITTKLSPLDELIEDNKTGFLIDIKDHDKWVEKLLLLLKNKDYANKIGQNGYNYCLQKFSLEKQLTEIDKVYSGLL